MRYYDMQAVYTPVKTPLPAIRRKKEINKKEREK
jgi:hypothetical protein